MKKKTNCAQDFVRTMYHIEAPSKETIKKLYLALADLTDREERIIRLRFGLDDDILRTYKEIGDEFGVTGARIQQIVKKAIKKLHHPVRKRIVLG